MGYRVLIHSFTRLFERQEVLIHFRFQAKIKNLRIDFIYQDQYSSEILHRETGIIISKIKEKTFFQYEVSAGYPRNAYILDLEIFLSTNNIYTNFEFYIQHFDFNPYRYH